LDKFSLEQVWRPYQTKGGVGDGVRLTSAPMNLDDTAAKLAEDTEWSRLVLSRIRACNFYFPPYVKHRLVDVVRAKP
jgi:hypothetical protein